MLESKPPVVDRTAVFIADQACLIIKLRALLSASGSRGPEHGD